MLQASDLWIGDTFVTEAGSSFDYTVVRKHDKTITAKDQFAFLRVFPNEMEVFEI